MPGTPASAGPPWVLLHGLICDARHWMDTPAHLGAAFPGVETHGIDLPGSGRERRRTSPLRVAAMTDDVRRRLRATELPPPYHVLALSLGGMVAAEWWPTVPGRAGAGRAARG